MNEMDSVEYDIRDMIDCKIRFITDEILLRTILPWTRANEKSDFAVGFRHGQVHELMERFYDIYPELFDVEKCTYKQTFSPKEIPTVVIDFGQTNEGLKAAYSTITIGGPNFQSQIENLMKNEEE
jgi:hypothetical protein